MSIPEYVFIPNLNDEKRLAIRILDGEFKDTVVSFGSVEFREVDDRLEVDYEIDILTLPGGYWRRKSLKNKSGVVYNRFIDMTKLIFDDIIINGEYKKSDDDDSIDDDDDTEVDPDQKLGSLWN